MGKTLFQLATSAMLKSNRTKAKKTPLTGEQLIRAGVKKSILKAAKDGTREILLHMPSEDLISWLKENGMSICKVAHLDSEMTYLVHW